MSKTHISVLICTWNNSLRLDITLQSFRNCAIPKDIGWELVIVNNNCTDDTDLVVNRYIDKLPIVYLTEREQGLSKARNTALAISRGEFILFTDDDVKPAEEWISAYWFAYIKKSEGYFFGGPVVSEFEIGEPDPELLKFATQSVSGLNFGKKEKVIERWYFIGPNWACPRSILDSVGGFDVTKGLNPASGKVIVGEEIDLMNRLREAGMQAFYVPMAKLLHFVPASKCTLSHVSQRQEAYYQLLHAGTLKDYKGLRFFGIPSWMYRKLASLFLKWIFVKASGKKGYKEYINYREMLGSMKGALEARTGATNSK
jgi:glycosyltransferase involved in cell wall biosynthesis